MARGSSVYFHGDVLPMLPEELSQDTCALSEGSDRPALVCKVAISDDGEVGDFEFIEAIVRSRGKLSYYGVERYLSGQGSELMSHATPLEALYQVFRALRATPGEARPGDGRAAGVPLDSQRPQADRNHRALRETVVAEAGGGVHDRRQPLRCPLPARTRGQWPLRHPPRHPRRPAG